MGNKFLQGKLKENLKKRRLKSQQLSSFSRLGVKKVWLGRMEDKLLDLFADQESNMMKTAFKEVRSLEWQQPMSQKSGLNLTS
jgi:hypothetical protein